MICYLQTKESFASEDHSCPQMTLPHMRNSSLWSEFVRSADFINVDESEAIQELVSQTAELKAIFNHFKELYVSYSYYFIKLSLLQTTAPAQRGYGDWSPPSFVDTLPLFQSGGGG